ncbi:hypothetical protein BKA83DRAFT_4009859, partial [Pisolithus microcarpus]
FMHSAMERYSLTEEEVRKHAIKAYDSVERTMKVMKIGEAENKAAMERVCFNSYAGIQVGVSVRSPKPGEEVTYSQLRDDLMVRVWGGDLESFEYYYLDFINHERKYVLTPEDLKIYTVTTPFSLSIQVLSMEDSLEKANAKSPYSHATRCDPNWETYLV